jgi:Ca-activated chloride channel family protein
MNARLLALLLLVPFALRAKAQPPGVPTTRILFLVDGSRSMTDAWAGGNKMAAAREVIGRIVDTLSTVPDLEMALRLYGHRSYQGDYDCQDSRLEVAFRPGNAKAIKDVMAGVRPKGITPIAYSLAQSAIDFPAEPGARNIIILITDGVESCDRDPCREVELLRQKNLLLRAFVIGLAVEPSKHDAFNCIGEFVNASGKRELNLAMERALQKVLSRTILQVDLMDDHGKAGETDVPMSFYGLPGGDLKYTFVHTFNDRGQSDTVYVEPILDYDLVVHTIPPVIRPGVEVEPNRFNRVAVPAGQGTLRLGTVGNTFSYRLQAIVYRAGGRETVHVQDFHSEREYRTGTYDLEILTLPRLRVKGLEIKQDHVTRFDIPAPGYATFVHSHEVVGGVFLERDGEWEEVYQLSTLPRNETIALQPGRYRLVFRARQSREMRATQVRDFTVDPGGSVSIRL